MWNTEIFFARKMKFLFDKKLFRWFDQPSNRCTYNHGRIHNFLVDVALFRRLSNAKIQKMESWNIKLEPFPREKCNVPIR